MDTKLQATYNKVMTGSTGIDAFDYWVKELVDTGYLHNHARMWFASIWIFTLKLDWTLGADFFLRHLMDADAASNTLSWRWVGGLHTKENLPCKAGKYSQIYCATSVWSIECRRPKITRQSLYWIKKNIYVII